MCLKFKFILSAGPVVLGFAALYPTYLLQASQNYNAASTSGAKKVSFMHSKLYILFATLSIYGCTTNPEKNFATVSQQEAAKIYNPTRFIQKVNDRKLDVNWAMDDNSIVELVVIDPGTTLIEGNETQATGSYGLTTYFTEYTFKFKFRAEAKHVYYFWSGFIDKVPFVAGRDLGVGFNPQLDKNYFSSQFVPKSQEERDNRKKTLDNLKEQGVPVEIEIIPYSSKK